MEDKTKKLNEHKVEKTFNEKQVVTMLLDAVMTAMGDEWVPQEDDKFKSFFFTMNCQESSTALAWR